MNLKFFVKPVKRFGLDQWLAFAVDSAGTVVWQATRWSERQVRSDAMRQATKYRQLNQTFKGV